MARIKTAIPNDILKIIKATENRICGLTQNRTRYYPYFEIQHGKLAISTVAARYGRKYAGKKTPTIFLKKVTVHILGEKKCWCRDISYIAIAGYVADFNVERALESKKTKYLINQHEETKFWYSDSKYFRLFRSCSFVNPEFLQQTEEFKYCAWEGIIDVLDYLEKYQKNPKIELVSKLLGNRLAMSQKIVNLATKDRNFIVWLKTHKSEIRYAAIPVIISAYKNGWTLKEAADDYNVVQEFRSWRRYLNGDELKAFYRKADRKIKLKIIEYMRNTKTSFHHYNDYLVAIKALGLDMTDVKNVFPKDFEYWSKIRLNQYATLKAEQDAKLQKELTERIKKIADKYEALTLAGDNYVVLIADSKQALIKEGEFLHHCVGRMDYDQRIAKEQSLIFFIRKANEKEIPFVTVEFSISEKKVRQCYGVRDTKPAHEVLSFVNDWAKKAKRRLQIIQRKVA